MFDNNGVYKTGLYIIDRNFFSAVPYTRTYIYIFIHTFTTIRRRGDNGNLVLNRRDLANKTQSFARFSFRAHFIHFQYSVNVSSVAPNPTRFNFVPCNARFLTERRHTHTRLLFSFKSIVTKKKKTTRSIVNLRRSTTFDELYIIITVPVTLIGRKDVRAVNNNERRKKRRGRWKRKRSSGPRLLGGRDEDRFYGNDDDDSSGPAKLTR